MTDTNRRAILAAAGSLGLSTLALPGMAQSKAPIRIGFSIAQTGALAAGGKSALLAREIWREDVNKAGGILGRPVEFVFYDDQSSGTNAPGIYAKLIDVDKVDLVIGPYAAPIQAPVMPLLKQRGMLALANFSYGVNDRIQYDRFFEIAPWGVGADAYCGAFIKLAQRNGLKKLAIMSADFEASQQMAEAMRAIAAKLEMQVVYDQKYPANTTEFSPLLRSLRAAQPEAVLAMSLPNESAAIIRSVNEIGVGPSVVMFGGGMVGLQSAPLLESLGPLLNGIVNYHTYVPEATLNVPGTQDFLTVYGERAVQAKVDPLGFYMAPFNYALGQIIAQAITATGGIDQGALAAYMKKTPFKTVVGDVSFGPTGQWVQPRMVQIQFQGIKSRDLAQFRQRGRQVIVEPPELVSGTLRMPFEKSRAA